MTVGCTGVLQDADPVDRVDEALRDRAGVEPGRDLPSLLPRLHGSGQDLFSTSEQPLHLDGNIRVWGARTMGGDANLDFKYVSTRRLFIFLRESIERGLSWAVFEPNDANLWAKINRSVGAFLTLVWKSGALFGATPEEAFFVKCDGETNPQAVRDAGQVVTEIGVALTSPAEFVIATEYAPEFAGVTEVIEKEEPVAPEMFSPLNRHW